MKVVADTNVFISALLFGGLPGGFLDLALLGVFSLAISPALLHELDEKLRSKFELPTEDAAVVRQKLLSVAELVTPNLTLEVVADDPDDNRVLECAVEANADYIVSGDRHLRKMKQYGGIPVLTVRQFLDLIAPEITDIAGQN